jgi:hypothetical protein
LAGNLNLVELLVLELDKPVTNRFQTRALRALIEKSLVAVSPSLQSLDILAQCRLRVQEVPLELLLFSFSYQ